MATTQGTRKRLPRHVPVPKAQHVYKSQRADGTWVYEVRHPVGADGKRPFETLPAGTKLEAAKERARQVHGLGVPRVTSVAVTFAEVVEDWRERRHVRPRTAESFDRIVRLHLMPRFGKARVRDIDRRAVEVWLRTLKRQDGGNGPLADGTRRQILAVLMIILRHAVEAGWLAAAPSLPRRAKPKASAPRRRVLSEDEEMRLLHYARVARFSWLAPIVEVALVQGLRLGEVMGLRWEDVDFAGKRLRVRHSLGRDGSLGPTKGGKERSIPLLPRAKEVLADLRMDRGGEGFVFLNRDGGARQLRDVQRAFDKARERAKLAVTEDGTVTFHTLRHTCLTRLANAPGVSLVSVRDFAGHSSITITNGYLHSTESAETVEAMALALAGGKEAA